MHLLGNWLMMTWKLHNYLMGKPMFMLRKPRGISMDNQNDWLKDIQSIKISGKMKDVISYLHWNLKKDALVDLPS